MSLLFLLFIFVPLIAVYAQDPVHGWLSYAMVEHPTDNNSTISKLEVNWQNLDVPKGDTNINSFFSPWIGIGTADRLNIIQCVNPWNNNKWELYNEYYQFKPLKNRNSIAKVSYPSDSIHASIEYKEGNQTDYYEMNLLDESQGFLITTRVLIQNAKKYTFAYFGFFTNNISLDCNLYPQNKQIVFQNISVSYVNDTNAKNLVWHSTFYNNACNNRAQISASNASGINDTVTIVWDTL